MTTTEIMLAAISTAVFVGIAVWAALKLAVYQIEREREEERRRKEQEKK